MCDEPTLTRAVRCVCACALACAVPQVPDYYRLQYPNLEAFPIMISSIAPYYSLPTGTVGTATLVLTREAMCRVWRGNITTWNDPAITSTNPELTFPAGAPIQPIQLDFANDANLAASRLCTKVDPGWAAEVGLSSWPRLPRATNLVNISFAVGSPGIGSYILDNPGSIGFSSPVTALKLQRAQMINRAGKTVSPTPATVSQAFLELAANGILPGGNGFDLSDAQSAYAWPANVAFWLMIDLQSTRSTCENKAAVLRFVLWLYSSDVVEKLVNEAQIAMPPLLYLENSGLLDRMRTMIQCDGMALSKPDSTEASFVGSSFVSSQLHFLTMMYTAVDSFYTYKFTAMDDALALRRVAQGEVDFAIIDPAAVTDQQFEQFLRPVAASVTAAGSNTSEGPVPQGGLILPSYLVGVVPTFNLPSALKSLYTQRSPTNSLGLPDLYPLRVDLETLASIFLGSINSWTDPRMVALNPQLGPWFDAVPNAPRLLSTVVCCKDPEDAQVAGTILLRALGQTAAFRSALGSAVAARLTARTIFPAIASLSSSSPYPSNQSFVDRETTMSVKLIMHPGSVGYRLINAGTTNPQTEFQLMRRDHDGDADETLDPTPASMQRCVAPQSLDDPARFSAEIANPKHRVWVTDEPGCWPLTAGASLALGSSYSSQRALGGARTVPPTLLSAVTGRPFSPCVRAQKTLELVRWLQVSPQLSAAAINSGCVRLSDFAAVQDYNVDHLLNSATCDGKRILITLPLVWSVSASATIFAVVAVSLLTIAFLVTLAVLYMFKSHAAIRGASPIFLAQVVLGLALMAGSLVAWASPVTRSSCMAFQWLVNLGFTLSFSPLFAKTWRIYQIFTTRRIKVAKITNVKLVWMVVLMLLWELVILTAWTEVSPMQPTLFERATTQADGAMRHTSHCAVASGAGKAFLAVEGAFKALLLILGSVYGFSTRHVSASYSESQTIATAIYNVVFSGLVVGLILAFMDTLGDTLIWIVLMLLFWVTLATWCFVFMPRFLAIASADQSAAARSFITPSRSSVVGVVASVNEKGAVSFVDIAKMSIASLQSYRVALEHQLRKVRAALGLRSQATEELELMTKYTVRGGPLEENQEQARTDAGSGSHRKQARFAPHLGGEAHLPVLIAVAEANRQQHQQLHPQDSPPRLGAVVLHASAPRLRLPPGSSSPSSGTARSLTVGHPTPPARSISQVMLHRTASMGASDGRDSSGGGDTTASGSTGDSMISRGMVSVRPGSYSPVTSPLKAFRGSQGRSLVLYQSPQQPQPHRLRGGDGSFTRETSVSQLSRSLHTAPSNPSSRTRGPSGLAPIVVSVGVFDSTSPSTPQGADAPLAGVSPLAPGAPVTVFHSSPLRRADSEPSPSPTSMSPLMSTNGMTIQPCWDQAAAGAVRLDMNSPPASPGTATSARLQYTPLARSSPVADPLRTPVRGFMHGSPIRSPITGSIAPGSGSGSRRGSVLSSPAIGPIGGSSRRSSFIHTAAAPVSAVPPTPHRGAIRIVSHRSSQDDSSSSDAEGGSGGGGGGDCGVGGSTLSTSVHASDGRGGSFDASSLMAATTPAADPSASSVSASLSSQSSISPGRGDAADPASPTRSMVDPRAEQRV